MSFVARYLPDTDIHRRFMVNYGSLFKNTSLFIQIGRDEGAIRKSEIVEQDLFRNSSNPCMLALFFLRFHANWYSFMEASSQTISIYFRRTCFFCRLLSGNQMWQWRVLYKWRFSWDNPYNLYSINGRFFSIATFDGGVLVRCLVDAVLGSICASGSLHSGHVP